MFHEQPELPFTPPPLWLRLMRKLRNISIFMIGVVLLIEFSGMPYLRVSYTYRDIYSQRRMVTATYCSLFDKREAVAGELGEGCPLIVFVHLEKPLWRLAYDEAQKRLEKYL